MLHIKELCILLNSKIKQYKVLLSNFGYLSALQIFSLFLPLITYPYLIRVLGKESFGQIALAQATIAYFSIIINYGFNISATKDVAINRNDGEKLSKIFSTVFCSKFILWVISFFILLFLIVFISPFNQNKLLYLLSFGVCFNELLFQQFFFQGFEKMRYITIINISSRLLFFCLIFIFVTQEEDYLYVPILNSAGALLGGIVALYIILKNKYVKFRIPLLSDIINSFKESSPFFLSRFSSVVINRSNTLLIGIFIGYTEVSYYDLAQKILAVMLIPFDIINQVTYPYAARTKNMQFVKKIVFGVICLAIVLYILLFIFKKYIILILGGQSLLDASPIVSMLCINVIFTSVTYFLGNTTLVVMNHSKEFNKSVIYTAIVYLLLNISLYYTGKFNLTFLVVNAILSELFCVSYRYYYVNKYRIFKKI